MRVEWCSKLLLKSTEMNMTDIITDITSILASSYKCK